MEPCFTSWTGFRVVSIRCVRSYEEIQHNPCDHPLKSPSWSSHVLVIDSVPLDRRSAYTPRVTADQSLLIMLTHTPDMSLCAIRLSSARLAIRTWQTQAQTGGCLFAWIAQIVKLKNCVAEKAATDASFAFVTPTKWTVFPTGIAPVQVVLRIPAAYLNVCESERYSRKCLSLQNI